MRGTNITSAVYSVLDSIGRNLHRRCPVKCIPGQRLDIIHVGLPTKCPPPSAPPPIDTSTSAWSSTKPPRHAQQTSQFIPYLPSNILVSRLEIIIPLNLDNETGNLVKVPLIALSPFGPAEYINIKSTLETPLLCQRMGGWFGWGSGSNYRIHCERVKTCVVSNIWISNRPRTKGRH